MPLPVPPNLWESLSTSFRVLFANPQPKKEYWTAIDESTTQRPSSSPSIDKSKLGYLVFPTDSIRQDLLFRPSPPALLDDGSDPSSRPPHHPPTSSQLTRTTSPTSATPSGGADGAAALPGGDSERLGTLNPEAQQDNARPNPTTSEARKGEEEWVRSGGILRDAHGNRDYARTEALRKELEVREEEKRLLERWERYEASWAKLCPRPSRKQSPISTPVPSFSSGSAPAWAPLSIADLTPGSPPERNIRFADIPWPVEILDIQRQIALSDLTLANVEEFLMGTLKRSGSQTAKRERIRNSLLRWHPDKMRGILARVVEEDVSMVEEGINAVVRCLQCMNNNLSTSAS